MNSIPIIYENDEIIVINKPCGLSVQGGQGVLSSVDTVLPKQLGFPVFLVHRLDKETAGLMVVAKSSVAAGKWSNLISSGQVSKEYIALCSGIPNKTKGIFSDVVTKKGKEQSAVTYYSLTKTFKQEEQTEKLEFSLLSLVLGTGRMHQIRIHLAKAGFPILADDKHGNFKLNKYIYKNFGIKKLQLASVSITIPVENSQKKITIPYPTHIESAINSI